MSLFLVAIAVSVPLSILRGFVAAVLWDWYVVPLTGLPPIGVATAIGLGAAVAVIWPYPMPHTDDDDDRAARLVLAVTRSVVLSTTCLATGWVALQFGGGS